MARRRRRAPINWKPWIVTGLVANLILGTFYSPLTAVVKVQVSGANPADQPRIKAILQRIHDQPAMQVDRNWVEAKMLEQSAIFQADMTRNVFGRARVNLQYRRPVAKVAGMPGIALGRDGVLFLSKDNLESLPSVLLPASANLPGAAIVGTWRSGEVAVLAAEMNGFMPDKPLEIVPLETGGLCLNIGSKFAVELGYPEKLEEKVDFLRKQVEDDPALLESGKTLNLVSIERPSYRQGIVKVR